LRGRHLSIGAASLALLAAGCGDDDDSGGEHESASPQEAIAEIGEVRTGLDQGLAAYKAGDAEQAEELVSTAYLEHFEVVEGPLEEADEELNEELEELIREEITGEIESGAPVKDVQALVAEAQAGLDQAEAVLAG
jgi:hypothetical protein